MILKVEKDYDNARFDRYLKEKIGLTHGLICKFTRNGFIKKNGKKSDFNARISCNDEIFISDLVAISEKSEKSKLPTEEMIEIVRKSIIFENDEIFLIDKPYGFAVQDGDGIDFSLIEVLKCIDKSAKIVHRLDKNTSGIMIFAKGKQAADKFSRFFRERVVKKTYIAVLDGILPQKSGKIATRIEKIAGNESLAKNVETGGDLAVSEYEVLATINKESVVINEENEMASEFVFCNNYDGYKRPLTIAIFRPITGRIHQIRLHALSLNAPILGDEKYNKRYEKGQKLQLLSYNICIENVDYLPAKKPKIPVHMKVFFTMN
ncbi:RluA family pseudouridine synthase [Candidatus Deianiraea vastatrix]|uniref:Ribosomal large subunit pseudouridine synthase C n=1 Tax=Candidatus Deianiraea vastatrix TaxID=2163644 RepID=A0A5B8XEX9_9RICK|nr:RluA family pseudouridine synthase [Candidatus Deianiraea vastatrix]QED23455.1 Ribosomal large subunit pseudouridine synthase C [Candidatus Deianiraea vastatrix]